MTIVKVHPVYGQTAKSTTDKTSTVAAGRQPAVNIIEEKEGYRIELATPGLGKSDFEIRINDNKLIVSGKGKKEDGEPRFFDPNFEKTFILPKKVDTDKISARSENGVLKIYLPKNDKVLTVKVS